jgi:hypothetical protein
MFIATMTALEASNLPDGQQNLHATLSALHKQCCMQRAHSKKSKSFQGCAGAISWLVQQTRGQEQVQPNEL